MTFVHLPPTAFLETPWRNGAGLTRQIAIHPAGASVNDPFQWRISTARVGSSGPFSAFPGLDRTLLLLNGPGMALDLGPDGTHRMERPFEPVAFSGDSPASGTLLAGACTDFNVFTRRGHCQQQVQVLRAEASLPAADPLILFVAQGTVDVEVFGPLPEGHALRIEGRGVRVTPGTDTVLLAVALTGA